MLRNGIKSQGQLPVSRKLRPSVVKAPTTWNQARDPKILPILIPTVTYPHGPDQNQYSAAYGTSNADPMPAHVAGGLPPAVCIL